MNTHVLQVAVPLCYLPMRSVLPAVFISLSEHSGLACSDQLSITAPGGTRFEQVVSSSAHSEYPGNQQAHASEKPAVAVLLPPVPHLRSTSNIPIQLSCLDDVMSFHE